ncbi:hypothetical protein Gogos_015718, partial [Gossypium gossypioides]|nr:hypothetical protein [Gossypium gossypioides]
FFPEEALEKSLPLEVLNYVKKHYDDCCKPLFFILLILARSTRRYKIRGICRYMFNNFKLLRVLNYEIRRTRDLFGGWKLPSDIGNDIGNLVHLRFLSLRNLKFQWSKLPSSLGNLRCLQTLDLRVGNCRIHVPNVIWRMEQLRHLYLPSNCKSSTKLKLGTLRKHLTLVNFNTKNCYLKDLINMTNLRELEIYGPFYIENFNEEELGENPPIIGSKYLHSLSIINYGEHGSVDPKHLAVSFLAVQEDPMPTLEKLPNLRILKLVSFEGKEMFCSAQGFPKLESLSLSGLHNLKEWNVDEGAMPSLQRLEIWECRNLKMLPEGLRFITTLKELKVTLMGKTFKHRLEEGGEDFYKVKH